MSGESNGIMKQEIHNIASDVKEIKDDLGGSVDRLTSSIDRLSDRFDDFMRVAENSIPIRAVFLMFVILVLALVGVEGAQFIFKEFLPKIM